MRVPSPHFVAVALWRIARALFALFDLLVMLTLLGLAGILNWLGLIRFGWVIIHWWRGDLKR
jgi:hypothetical protein